VVLRDGEPQDLRRAARTVAAGGLLLTQGMTRRVAASLVSVHVGDGVVAPEVQVLTGREREVLGLVGHGFNNAEIGARLHISAATVKAHVGGMIAKLDARDRAALVTLAYETGLVLPAARRSRGAPLSGVRDERPDVGPSS
jgi:DNA-binding NarL/FixJ family response regulator